MSAVSSDAVQALLIADIQTAFVTGDEAAPASDQLLVNLSDLLDRAREAGALVVHLQNDGPSGAVDEPGRPGWELYFRTADSPRELVIRKLKDDGFDGTPLGKILRRHGVCRVCIVGVMSEICVLATAGTALNRKFGVVIPHDGHVTFNIGPAPGTTEGVPQRWRHGLQSGPWVTRSRSLRTRPTSTSSRSFIHRRPLIDPLAVTMPGRDLGVGRGTFTGRGTAYGRAWSP